MAERLRSLATQRPSKQPAPAPPPEALAPAPPPAAPAPPSRPWAEVRAGTAPLILQSRTTQEPVARQPWTTALVDVLLSAAHVGGVHLCLCWPIKLQFLPLLHALANVERIFARDLRGMRTLLYPGTHACRSPLESVLLEKSQLSDFFRTLWRTGPHGTLAEVCTESPALLAALNAINDIRSRHPELLNPSFAELVPTFVFDSSRCAWASPVASPLERTLSKVERLSNRRDLRQKISSEWALPEKAPGALMVIHHTTGKDGWRLALSAPVLKGLGRPELLLLDATQAAARSNYDAVRRIPDFLGFAREHGFDDIGAVIVTDDPKTFFALRASFGQSNLILTNHVWPAEGEDALLTAPPALPTDWRPALRSNSNFSVSIVDREASQVALAFQRLAESSGSDGSPQRTALIEACLFVLRLSNMPAGYQDLIDPQDEQGDFATRLHAWSAVKLPLDRVLASGVLNKERAAVAEAIKRAEKMVDDWNDATPLASRLLAEVRKHCLENHQVVSLVLPSRRYIELAYRFLRRRLGNDWSAVEPRLEWHTLSAVAKTLSSARKHKHLVFVGITPDVVRLLVTHPDIPHGTAVLVAYKQADSTSETLGRMMELDAFKPYRGRMGLLLQELKRRLAEVPNPIVIAKLREASLTFRLEDTDRQSPGGEHTYYKFLLEGGGRAYASGFTYRHDPQEDPPFRRVPASSIQVGDFVFEMSDDLRSEVEALLDLNPGGAGSTVDPVRVLLKMYHSDMQNRCRLFFKAADRQALAREIQQEMCRQDPSARDCRPERVCYWLAIQDNDTRPHAAKDARYFKLFCRALRISDETAQQYWAFVRSARRFNQDLGRQLAARYAEILFQPESAATYRKVPERTIKRLQQEALSCVYRVEQVVPPEVTGAGAANGRSNADA